MLLEGAYHVLYACRALLDARDLDEDDLATALTTIDDAIDMVASVADAEMKADPAMSYTRLFKDKRTTKKIDGAIREDVRGAISPKGPK